MKSDQIISTQIYTEHKDRSKRIQSATVAIRAILQLNLYPAHKRELLGVCIWKITEADGKKKVRYWSEGAISSKLSALQHEHVYERKELISRLLNNEAVDLVVKDAVACLVTKEEHYLLGSSNSSGWQRYIDVGVKVLDTKDQKWIL